MIAINQIRRFCQNYSPLLIISSIIFYILIFGAINFWKYFNFGYDALDLAIINQVFYNSAQGNFFVSSIHPPNYLGDHLELIIILLLPFYLILPRPLTLLVLQTLALAISAWPIYLISKKVIAKNWAAFLALVWLLNPFVQNINLFEFHLLPFALPLIFWAFYFYQNQKFLPFLSFIILSLLVREDVALVIFGFGLLALVEKKKLKWWLVPTILSTSYFILALKIISLFSDLGQYKFLIYYSWLGNGWLEFFKNLILKFWTVFAHLINPTNLGFILGLLLPFVFLPLFKPKYLILGAAIFIQLIFSFGGAEAILQTHYSTLLLPALIIGLIYALADITKLPPPKGFLVNLINRERILSFLIFVTTILYSSFALGPIPGALTKLYQQGIFWPAAKIKNEMIKKIPPQAAVSATFAFLPHLANRQKIYSFNYAFLGKKQFLAQDYSLPKDTEYLLIDFQDLITYQLQYGQNPYYQRHYQSAFKNWPKILEDFGLIEINDTVALYKKGEANKFALIQTYSLAGEGLPKIDYPQNIFLADKIKFLGYNKLADHYQFFWRAQKELAKNYELELILEKDSKIIYQKIYPLAYDIFPTSLWPKDRIIQTNYWFSFDKNLFTKDSLLKINLIEIKKGGIEIDSIRSTKNVIDEKEILGQSIKLFFDYLIN